jgi:hypothetical protein
MCLPVRVIQGVERVRNGTMTEFLRRGAAGMKARLAACQGPVHAARSSPRRSRAWALHPQTTPSPSPSPLQSVKDMPVVQDGPPPGGFPAIRYARRVPSTGPGGFTLFAGGSLCGRRSASGPGPCMVSLSSTEA